MKNKRLTKPTTTKTATSRVLPFTLQIQDGAKPRCSIQFEDDPFVAVPDDLGDMLFETAKLASTTPAAILERVLTVENLKRYVANHGGKES